MIISCWKDILSETTDQKPKLLLGLVLTMVLEYIVYNMIEQCKNFVSGPGYMQERCFQNFMINIRKCCNKIDCI